MGNQPGKNMLYDLDEDREDVYTYHEVSIIANQERAFVAYDDITFFGYLQSKMEESDRVFVNDYTKTYRFMSESEFKERLIQKRLTKKQ